MPCRSKKNHKPPEISFLVIAIPCHLLLWKSLTLFTKHKLDLPKVQKVYRNDTRVRVSKNEPVLLNSHTWLCHLRFSLCIAKIVYNLLLIEHGAECTWDTFFLKLVLWLLIWIQNSNLVSIWTYFHNNNPFRTYKVMNNWQQMKCFDSCRHKACLMFCVAS